MPTLAITFGDALRMGFYGYLGYTAGIFFFAFLMIGAGLSFLGLAALLENMDR